ncbi:MAG: indolepyruvate oxidoreductase subunit beta [Victivallales bacterium]|nr:indolepyruvate oxidoreductase subunit beta [Victivallales bacterium]
MNDKVINVTFAGIGGQGVLKASDILAEAAFLAGCDVKKSEVHGMSQRGGSVSSEVRFGNRVNSPMVPDGESDYLVVLATDQTEVNRHKLCSDGMLITPDDVNADQLANAKCLNVALLGRLSRHLGIKEEYWIQALTDNLPTKVLELNVKIFREKAAAEA